MASKEITVANSRQKLGWRLSAASAASRAHKVHASVITVGGTNFSSRLIRRLVEQTWARIQKHK